ncbi:3-hydroxyacyl-[acyl-carrier-protein] dehydratase [Desulfobaculum xiamenense]|uniref:3-hydroxyacyl-[acyl-carrier-protein] dehydratase FabZ n=1 Tax=Desulfobaculum xiamenense TaxID=995050 RepID=A0A846QJ31_9BACT|nr:3-hydroxyacyl-ACP dehydratase FabZ [Desulfobaculum xiamenense]NJB68876.1 3-hydroxyacyl-[acyl-carrier-protein] dehydratase [Desulfobaculum xiamenense]
MSRVDLGSVDIQGILKMLPHRYPFLMVDRITEFVPGESINAYKNVTFNEPFFQGHFPELPVMPGVMICESLAQAGGLLVGLTDGPERAKGVFMFTGLDKVRFRRPVRPGDKLELRVSGVRRKLNIVKMHGVALVDGEVACEGDMSAALVKREDI